MILKNVVSAQYKTIVNEAKAATAKLIAPKEGWIRTVRKALGMSAIQLSRRLAVSRSLISRTENEELKGAVTLKTMEKIAHSLGCHFIYAIVPDKKIEDILLEQARLKAKSIVDKTNVQMALEEQLLSDEKIQFEIERLTEEMLKGDPADLWDVD